MKVVGIALDSAPEQGRRARARGPRRRASPHRTAAAATRSDRRLGGARRARRRRGASSSRSATRRRIRREEPSAAGDDLLLVGVRVAGGRGSPRAARGWRGCSSAGCAARARRRRRSRAVPGSSARVSAAGGVELAEHLVEGSARARRPRPRLSGIGTPRRIARGRRSRARSRSAKRSGASPGPRPRGPASVASIVPPITPADEQQPEALDGRVSESGCARTAGRPGPPAQPCRAGRSTTSNGPFWLIPVTGGPRSGACGVWRTTFPSASTIRNAASPATSAPRLRAVDPDRRVAAELIVALQLARDAQQVVAEVVADPAGRERPDDHREADEDDQGQAGRDGRDPPADRPALRVQSGGPAARGRLSHRRVARGARSRRRAWCAGGGARRPPRACGAGSR